jgi:hypothetical protein
MLNAVSFIVPAYVGHQGFLVVRADTPDLSELVYRFRYHIYVEQMGRRQIYADHITKSIKEPLDELGDNFLAIKDGRLIGTIRRNRLDDPSTAYYQKIYRSNLFDMSRDHNIATTTKLMLLPEYRQSMYSVRLIKEYADHGYRDGVQVELLDCNKHLVQFFEKMGYFSYCGWTFHKEFGKVRPMFFASDITAYMTEVNSFLTPVAEKNDIIDGMYGGYELVERLAEEPWNPRIRHISAKFRMRTAA